MPRVCRAGVIALVAVWTRIVDGGCTVLVTRGGFSLQEERKAPSLLWDTSLRLATNRGERCMTEAGGPAGDPRRRGLGLPLPISADQAVAEREPWPLGRSITHAPKATTGLKLPATRRCARQNQRHRTMPTGVSHRVRPRRCQPLRGRPCSRRQYTVSQVRAGCSPRPCPRRPACHRGPCVVAW